MNSNITVEDCLCLTNPEGVCRIRCYAKTRFTEEF